MNKSKEPLMRVHITKDLHRRLKSEAALAGKSLRAYLAEAITEGILAIQFRQARTGTGQ